MVHDDEAVQVADDASALPIILAINLNNLL